MNLKHTSPCSECPWRKESAEGWLGGHDANYYSDAVAEGEIPACHCQDHGADDTRSAFCAGAASVMANMCMLPHKQPGAAGAVQAVGKSTDTFGHAAMFYKHHTGNDWVPRFMR